MEIKAVKNELKKNTAATDGLIGAVHGSYGVLYLSGNKTNSDLCHLHLLIGLYNRDEICLLRGTNCSLPFVFKWLISALN